MEFPIAFSQTPAQAGECGRLCDTEFWKSATPPPVATLLAAGMDVKARTAVGMTPLHWAAVGSNENPAVVKVLLDAGADVKARTVNGGTPLHRAVGWKKNPAMYLERRFRD